MEIQPMKIGERIAALRRAKGLTQEQLAAALGISAPAVSKWERDSSYPDITLLCPLARALDTDVDTLLQFDRTLPDGEVLRHMNEIIELTRQKGAAEGEAALMALLQQYPGCAALQWNGASLYDVFQLFFPDSPEASVLHWQESKARLLEALRKSGSAAYWQGATLGLANLSIAAGELEKAEALLQELPEQQWDPTLAWVHLHLARKEPEAARDRAQKRLYALLSQSLSCLCILADGRLQPGQAMALQACRAYKAIAGAAGLPDMSDGLLIPLYLEAGEVEKAAEAFRRYVDALTGPVPALRVELFCPGVASPEKAAEPRPAAGPELRRMLLKSIQQDGEYAALCENPVFAAALEKLRASLGD